MRSFVFACALVLAACGGDDVPIDDVVGSTCDNDRQCEERCYIDNDKYPGGFCSLSCASDQDCPAGTYCVDENGGLCLFGCPELDCAELGPGWICKQRSRAGGGNVDVCFGD